MAVGDYHTKEKFIYFLCLCLFPNSPAAKYNIWVGSRFGVSTKFFFLCVCKSCIFTELMFLEYAG